MFSELDKLLLPWLPYIISMLLGIWLITGAREAKENPKPLPAKATKKSAVAALIVSEYQKHSK